MMNATDDLVFMDADGANSRTVRSFVGNIAWSPDGRTLAYAIDHGASANGFGPVSRNGLVSRWISFPGAGVTGGVRWSPDGKRVAVWGSKLWIAYADGSNPEPFCPPATGCLASASVDWSPDGRTLVIDMIDRFWIVDTDSTNAIEVLAACPTCSNVGTVPRWSPDGSLIAFTMGTPTGSNRNALFVVNADGSSPRRLTPDSSAIRDLRWRPSQ